MTEPLSVSEKLRSAFSVDEESGVAGESCPEPDRIWEAVHARLPLPERIAMVDHVSRCASCAADWRVALRSDETSALREPLARRAIWPVLAAAAAALLFAGFLAVFRLTADGPAPQTYRNGEQADIRSLIPDDEPLPRDGFELRWSDAGEGARYRVEVDTVRLEPVASARDLEETRFLVPREALERLASGETLVWRVEARLPDGRRLASAGLLARVE